MATYGRVRWWWGLDEEHTSLWYESQLSTRHRAVGRWFHACLVCVYGAELWSTDPPKNVTDWWHEMLYLFVTICTYWWIQGPRKGRVIQLGKCVVSIKLKLHGEVIYSHVIGKLLEMKNSSSLQRSSDHLWKRCHVVLLHFRCLEPGGYPGLNTH